MDFEQLKKEQAEIAEKVIAKDDYEQINLIGGCDAAFFSNKVVAVAAVFDPKMKLLEKASAVMDVHLPYIPGLLFYREGEAIIEAYRKLTTKPDVLMVDGNGILHPLRCGMASHIGVLLDIPTIGVAKSLSIGKVREGKVFADDEVLGAELRTRDYSRPLYISAGHRISLEKSLEVARKCIKYPHKLPEPIHAAHRIAEALKDSEP